MLDLAREIGQTLQRNKLRTALTGFAVAWGVFMLMTLLAAANGVTNAFEHDFLSGDNQKLTVFGGRTSRPYGGYREGRAITLKDDDMKRVAQDDASYVGSVSSSIDGEWGTISTGTHFVRTSFRGVFPEKLYSESSVELSEGRLLNDHDLNTTAKVIVLPKDYAKQLFPPDGNNVVGQRVDIGGLSFKVVGVYDTRWNRQCYIPYTTARMMSVKKDEIGSMEVHLQNVATEDDGRDAEQAVRKTLAAAHNFDPADDGTLWVMNDFVMGIKGLQAMNILNIAVWALGILTLLSGIVGISNIMFVSVRERTHEIGIRRALGAKPRKILMQIIAEAIAITTIFGYIGIIMGVIAGEVLDRMFGDSQMMRDPRVNLMLAIEVTVVLVLSGALAGLFPARRALKIKPVEALRDE